MSVVPVAEAAPHAIVASAPFFSPPMAQRLRPAASTKTVAISANGFSPTTLNVFGPTDIAWENRSGITVTVRSGLPGDPGTTVFLPTIMSDGGGAATSAADRARTVSRLRNAEVDFSVTLGPRDIFVQRYSAPGSYDFHLAEAPQTGAQNLEGKLILDGTGLLFTSPQDGEDGVAVTRETILAFSAPLDPATVTKSVFAASAAGTPLDFRLHHSGDRRQVTLFYANPLPGNALIEVTIDGTLLRDENGGQVDVDGDNLAGGAGVVSFTTLSLATVPGTSVCGRVFASQLAPSGGTSVNEPLQGATITVDGREQEMKAVTDNLGNFCLDPSPAGRFFVHIDGRTAGNATPQGGYYPFVGRPGNPCPASRPSWMLMSTYPWWRPAPFSR